MKKIDLSSLHCRFEMVTPEKAQVYLDTMLRNRNIRASRVELYKEKMRRGDWLATCQGIGFDEAGHLIEGQHRLQAIIASGQTVVLLVVRGLKTEAQLVMDQPAIRQMHEQIHLSRGLETTTQSVAIAKQMMASVSESDTMRLIRRDIQLVERFYIKYSLGIRYAMNLFAKEVVPGITIAPVMAPIARAYYSVDEHEILDEFAECVITGFQKRRTATAAIALRNWLIQGQSHSRRMAARLEAYKRTELALDAFINRRPILRMPKTTPDHELFPLPAERKLLKVA